MAKIEIPVYSEEPNEDGTYDIIGYNYETVSEDVEDEK